MPSTARVSLNIGDIIRIDGKRGMALVIRSKEVVSEDGIRGEVPYRVDEFDTVAFKADTKSCTLVNPKVSKYYFNDGSMTGSGVGVERSRVQIVGSADVKAARIDYSVKAAKLA